MAHDESFSEVRELAGDCIELLVNVGIIDSISPRWPPEVVEQWTDRLQLMRGSIARWTREVQEFASAWDDRE